MGRDAERPSPIGRALAWLLLAPLALLGVMLAYLPCRAGLWMGRRLGDLAYWVVPGRRAVARDNLERAFGGERNGRELDRLCRESFRHLGMTLVEACTFFFRPPSVLGASHLMNEGRSSPFTSTSMGPRRSFASSSTKFTSPI